MLLSSDTRSFSLNSRTLSSSFFFGSLSLSLSLVYNLNPPVTTRDDLRTSPPPQLQPLNLCVSLTCHSLFPYLLLSISLFSVLLVVTSIHVFLAFSRLEFLPLSSAITAIFLYLRTAVCLHRFLIGRMPDRSYPLFS